MTYCGPAHPDAILLSLPVLSTGYDQKQFIGSDSTFYDINALLLFKEMSNLAPKGCAFTTIAENQDYHHKLQFDSYCEITSGDRIRHRVISYADWLQTTRGAGHKISSSISSTCHFSYEAPNF